MADWAFEVLPRRMIEQNPTQRDQFNNDDVGLAEALVREVIQNSTDAPAGEGPVKVTFAVHSVGATASAELRGMFAALRPHLKECGISPDPVDAGPSRLLVVEDFGTKGLTGSPSETDRQNFHNFWRAHGNSAKRGGLGGRWGLGKLVYSSASEIRSFFGLTVRAGDATPLLMGQSVLKIHQISGKRYVAHGFWFGERGEEDVQLPVVDEAIIAGFCKLTQIVRQMQPGLSVVVPYLREGIDEEAIIDAVLRNYYFPILAGKLSVEVGPVTIDRDNFHAVAAARPEGKSGAPIALEFVEKVSASLDAMPSFIASSALNRTGLSEQSFTTGQIEQMKATYLKGELLAVQAPVTLKRKGGEQVSSFIRLYLQAPPDGARPFALFVRGSITVPGEARYFGGIHAFGAMVATDPGITEFLGDAENPAHTNWTASAEKLADNWAAPGSIVKNVRYALRDLYLLVAEQVARKDPDALLDLFYLVDPARSGPGARKRSQKPKIEVKPKEKAISIRGRSGGFEIVAGPGAAHWTYPRKIRIRVAYDTMVGNAFNAHSAHDFDLTKGDIEFDTEEASVEARSANVLVASVTGKAFSIFGRGFDSNRDIVVDARSA